MPLFQIVGNPTLPEKFKGKTAARRGPNGAVRLSPVPARNTLLTILFFSAVAMAIGYWIFFPPIASQPIEQPTAPFASPAPATLATDTSASSNQ